MKTHSITTFRITALRMTALRITTLSITTLSITTLRTTDCHIFIAILRVIMLSVSMLSANILSIVILSVVALLKEVCYNFERFKANVGSLKKSTTFFIFDKTLKLVNLLFCLRLSLCLLHFGNTRVAYLCVIDFIRTLTYPTNTHTHSHSLPLFLLLFVTRYLSIPHISLSLSLFH